MTKYSIEQFSQITGISKFVLRTWENRYGYLKAERTDTKIRFYTDELLWMQQKKQLMMGITGMF